MKFFLAAVLILASCTSVPVVERRELSIDDFLLDQKVRWETFRNLGGKINIGVSGGKETISGTGRIAAEPFARRLWFEIRDVLGRPQLTVVVEGTKCLVVYPAKKQAFEDSQNGRLYLARWGIPMDFTELMAFSFGGLPGRWRIDRASWKWDGNAYHLKAVDRESTIRIWAHPVSGAITRIQKEDYTVDFSEFDGELSVAMSVRFQASERALAIEWEEGPKPEVSFSSAVFAPVVPEGVLVENIRQ